MRCSRVQCTKIVVAAVLDVEGRWTAFVVSQSRRGNDEDAVPVWRAGTWCGYNKLYLCTRAWSGIGNGVSNTRDGGLKEQP